MFIVFWSKTSIAIAAIAGVTLVSYATRLLILKPTGFWPRIAIGITFGGFLIATYIKYENWRQILEFSATVMAGITGITLASYAAQNLTFSAEGKRVDRALSFVARWNDPSFNKQEALTLMRDVIEQSSTVRSEFTIHGIENANALKAEVSSILNFFEEMALTIQYNYADENTLREFFREIVLSYVEIFSPWIELRRVKSKSSKVFQELMELNQRWLDENKN